MADSVKNGPSLPRKAFENWVFHELSVHIHTLSCPYDISYWRLSSGIEVEFILGDAETAIEVKGKKRVHSGDLRHLEQFRKEFPEVKQLITVCMEPKERVTESGIRILPYQDSLRRYGKGTSSSQKFEPRRNAKDRKTTTFPSIGKYISKGWGAS